MTLLALHRERWQAVVDAVLPGTAVGRVLGVESGGSHEVLVLPGVAAIRVAATAEARELMPRRMELLHRLSALSLPFAVPQPLSAVISVDGVTAAAVSWVPGAVHGRGSGDAGQLARLLVALQHVDICSLSDVLDVPHAFAGRQQWGQLLSQEVLPRLPVDVRVQASPSLVHGDLAGHNLLWNPDGTLCGVVDWDLACAFDPAVDAACLAWFGWSTVHGVTDIETYRRARVWAAVFGLEQISAAVLQHRSEIQVAALTARIAEGLRTARKNSG